MTACAEANQVLQAMISRAIPWDNMCSLQRTGVTTDSTAVTALQQNQSFCLSGNVWAISWHCALYFVG